MTLLTPEIRERLLANGRHQAAALHDTWEEVDFAPVCKLCTPDAEATWLLTELDPVDPDLAFGLCDLGIGAPEAGYVRISDLEGFSGPFDLPVERDLHFKPANTLRGYLEVARRLGRVVA